MNATLTTDPRKTLGDLGERLAVHHLEANGYTLLQRRYRKREGEIDIVAQTPGTIALVEVKCRRGDRHGTAGEAISWTKAQRMITVSEIWLSEHPEAAEDNIRIDLIAIDFTPDGRLVALNHHENAITPD